MLEDIAAELHGGMLSRWLFNHIRNDTMATWMQPRPICAWQCQSGATKRKTQDRVAAKLEQRQQKKGWLARLLSR